MEYDKKLVKMLTNKIVDELDASIRQMVAEIDNDVYNRDVLASDTEKLYRITEGINTEKN